MSKRIKFLMGACLITISSLYGCGAGAETTVKEVESTTHEVTTDEPTTQEITTQEITTEEPTTKYVKKGVLVPIEKKMLNVLKI